MKNLKVNEFQKKKYLENLKLLSKFRNEKSSAYVYLVATFISLSFLVFFAIGPTIGTITELQKRLEDSKTADAKLSEKIANLNNLNSQYNQISVFLPLVMLALPEEPSSTSLLARIQTAAELSSVEILSLSSNNIPVLGIAGESVDSNTIDFSVSVKGSYGNLMIFFKNVANFDRIVSIPSFSISREGENENGSASSRILTIEGKAYYQK